MGRFIHRNRSYICELSIFHWNFNWHILVTNGRPLQYYAFITSRLKSTITLNMETLKTYINSVLCLKAFFNVGSLTLPTLVISHGCRDEEISYDLCACSFNKQENHSKGSKHCTYWIVVMMKHSFKKIFFSRVLCL